MPMITSMDEKTSTDLPSPEKKYGGSQELFKSDAYGEISEAAVVAEGEEKTTWFVWALVCCCSVSGLLFGAFTCDILILVVPCSRPWIRLRHWCHLWRSSQHWNRFGWPSAYQWPQGMFSVAAANIKKIVLKSSQELITSATTLGALLGGLAAGIISDWTGRRVVLGLGDILFLAGAIAQAVCHTVWSMASIRHVNACSCLIKPLDWWSLLNWHWRRSSCMYSAPLYPRAVPNTPSWAHGRA
jgi:SP family myo-inositol transporter-like MFS transporter 13